MKVAVSATGPGLEALVDDRFGRCPYLVLVDPNTLEAESVENTAGASRGGSGVATAQAVVNRGIKVVLTGHVGPNAHEVLSRAGVKVYGGASGTVREAAEAFRRGKLASVSAATAPPHSGMGSG